LALSMIVVEVAAVEEGQLERGALALQVIHLLLAMGGEQTVALVLVVAFLFQAAVTVATAKNGVSVMVVAAVVLVLTLLVSAKVLSA
jgi:hypothetical protein